MYIYPLCSLNWMIEQSVGNTLTGKEVILKW